MSALGDAIGSAINTAINALSAGDQAVSLKVWQALGAGLEAYLGPSTRTERIRWGSSSWSANQWIGSLGGSGSTSPSGHAPFYGPAVGGEVVSKLYGLSQGANTAEVELVVSANKTSTAATATGVKISFAGSTFSEQSDITHTYTLAAGDYVLMKMNSGSASTLISGHFTVSNIP